MKRLGASVSRSAATVALKASVMIALACRAIAAHSGLLVDSGDVELLAQDTVEQCARQITPGKGRLAGRLT